jgi:outer membrane immunogenic protein
VLDGNGDGSPIYDAFPGSAGVLELNWGASIRAQAGFVMDRWLVYAAGGVAYISLSGCTSNFVVQPGCFPGTSFDDDRWGWTAGAGIAYAFSPSLSGR